MIIRSLAKGIVILDSRPEWKALQFTDEGIVTDSSIKNAMKIIRPERAEEATQLINHLIETRGKDSIWSKITPLDGVHTFTIIPRSLIISVEGENIYMNPNSTKHFEEFIAWNPAELFIGSFSVPSEQLVISQEHMLNELYESLKIACNEGIKYDMPDGILYGKWELNFDRPRIENGYPVLKHLLYKG